MNVDQSKIVEILLRQNYVTAEDIKKAEDYLKNHEISLVDYLIGSDIITKDLLGQAIAESWSISYADLNSNQPTPEQVMKINEDLAREKRVVVFKLEKDLVVIATDNPGQKNLAEDLAKLFPNQKIRIAYSLPEDIDEALVAYRKSLETRFTKIIEKNKRVAPEILDEMLADVLAFKASDVHFEPEEKEVVVRFRVDGVLQEAGRLPREYYENILNRIKVLAHLRIDEHSDAQDGAIRYANKNINIDLRVSIVPTMDGEKIVMRVLSEYVQGLGLSELGFSTAQQAILEQASKKPFGMIVVAGPTGSGKTTTLYALLKKLNRPEVNITTIEDPVEYKIVGINQIQINSQTDLTFAKGLRSIIRQDPDIILVGEIRDHETAEIAVNAALTGHLLFSTFHANDAATAIPRLLDMDVEPFLLASTLELIIAQRLARKICEHCRYSISLSKIEIAEKHPEAARFFADGQNTFYQGKGCDVCNHTGYKGRTAVYEFIKITPEIENLMIKHPSKQEILALVKQQGFISMFEDGLLKVRQGTTTLDELLRVVEAPEK
jgi:type II secretory ATPase GspE/PulE/Tfp pilus assembly ATPase PilB-like protein